MASQTPFSPPVFKHALSGNRVASRMAALFCWVLAAYIAGCFAAAIYYSVSRPSAGALMAIAGAALIAVVVQKTGISRIINRSVVLPFIIGTALRLFTLAIPNTQVSDFRIFEELAESLVNNTGFSYTGATGLGTDVAAYMNNPQATPPVPTAFRLPGYPLLLSFMFHFFDNRNFAVKLLNCLLQLIMALALFLLLQRRGNTRSGLIAVWLWALYPGSILFTALACTEIAFTALLLSSAVLIDILKNAALPKKAILPALLCGLSFGGTMLIRPASQLLFCGGAVLMMIKFPSRVKPLVASLFLIGLLIPLCIWGLRNQRTLGHFELQTTEMGLGFYTLTRELLPVELDRSVDTLIAAMNNSSDEFERARLGKKIGIQRFKIALCNGIIVKRMGQNHLKAWREDSEFDWVKLGMAESRRRDAFFTVITYVNLAWFLVILFFALRGAVDLAKGAALQTRGTLFLNLFLLASGLLLLFFEGQPRYHFPLMMIMIVMAAKSLGENKVPGKTTTGH